jgi:hypothetical protein
MTDSPIKLASALPKGDRRVSLKELAMHRHASRIPVDKLHGVSRDI